MTKIVFANFKGGTGKSLVCGMVGRSLAGSGRSAFIVDLDAFAPSVGMMFGLEPTVGSVETAGEKLSVWTVPPDLEPAPDWTSVKSDADFRLIDTAPGGSALTIQALGSADRIILASTPEPAALLGALRTAREAVKANPHVPFALVVNQVRGPSVGTRVAERFDAALGRFLSTGLDWSASLPFLAKAHRSALRRSVNESDCALRPVASLAARIADWAPVQLERVVLTALKGGQDQSKAA